MASESPPRRSEFLFDSLVMNSRPFSMERPLVEEDPFPDRRGGTECLPFPQHHHGRSSFNLYLFQESIFSVSAWQKISATVRFNPAQPCPH
ncbi:MAG: hypothetical protein L3J03_04350 [Desulfobacterales bacterium]|nr:hypothetical protein [Desulfobacterales bacterium]